MSVIDHPLTTAPEGTSLITKILRFRELAILVAIVLVFVLTYLKSSSFASTAAIQQLLSGPALIMLLAVGETLVIITRNVDLSVGSVLGLSAYLVGDLFVHYPGMPVALALLIGLLIGLVCGVVNGLIVAYARVPSLVVTLGMLYIIRGVDAIVVNGVQIQPSSIPQSFVNLGAGAFLGIPYLFIISAVVIAIVGPVRDRLESRCRGLSGSAGAAPRLWGLRHQRRSGRSGWRTVVGRVRHRRVDRWHRV